MNSTVKFPEAWLESFSGPCTPVILLGNYCPLQVLLDLQYDEFRFGLDYADSYRAVRKYHPAPGARKRFAQCVSCCGVYESSTIVDGVEWIIGCNYGH